MKGAFNFMPQLTINRKTFEVELGKRLVLAIAENGINIGHRCGGNARCTTCRVEFESGEPKVMTQAEYDKLETEGLLEQVRLSCQLTCDHDMSLRPIMTLESESWSDTGPQPEETVTPESVWFPIDS